VRASTIAMSIGLIVFFGAALYASGDGDRAVAAKWIGAGFALTITGMVWTLLRSQGSRKQPWSLKLIAIGFWIAAIPPVLSIYVDIASMLLDAAFAIGFIMFSAGIVLQFLALRRENE
jgi:vacuolar-type H+-ATPase subunit I/STV1